MNGVYWDGNLYLLYSAFANYFKIIFNLPESILVFRSIYKFLSWFTRVLIDDLKFTDFRI